MPIDYLILAGPQAAGKSTLAKAICSTDPRFILLQESRQIIVHRSQRKGAIFMTRLDEIDVIHTDMARMFSLLCQDDTGHLYLDETNIFTLAHARAHGIDLLEGYYRQYCDLLRQFRTTIIFVAAPPDISWQRRQPSYVERLADLSDEEKVRTMSRYKAYLNRLYPELLSLYEALDFPKYKIDGTLPQEEVYRTTCDTIMAFYASL